jgi:hypothetical protein
MASFLGLTKVGIVSTVGMMTLPKAMDPLIRAWALRLILLLALSLGTLPQVLEVTGLS